jgi:hypothetical protein
VAVLLSFPVFAAEPLAPVSVEVRAAPLRFALAVTSTSLVAIGSSVLGGVVALGVPSACTVQFGAPRPMCGVAGLALAGATQLLVSLIAIPELFRINGNDPAAIRAAWWRWARIPAGLLAVSVLVFFAGSVSEQNRYGTGQGAMLASMGGAALSGVTVDVLGIIGAARAARGLQ